MTELYIDKQRVVLPETFSITIIEENPFFTKNGKYTYDITLSLLDPINARIYKHLNRINRKGEIPKNRSAYLVVDNEVVLNGTEVILEHTDNQVKIQLVSGNSELNFLIGGDRKLRDLDLGVADVNPDTIKDDLSHPYPERNWLILPYIARNLADYYPYSSFIFNRWWLRNIGDRYELRYQFDGNTYVDTDSELSYYKNFRPQPYLCFIIEAVLKSLGYTLTFNSLAEHTVLRYMYIVHGFDTWEFAKMLPDWTVNEFLTKIETQFDSTFIVNEFTKEAGLYFNYDDLIDETITVEMEDEYTLEVDEDNVRSIQSANIGYDISTDDDEYYLYQKLDKSVKEAALSDTYSSPNNLLSKIYNLADPYRFRKIFKEYRSGDIIAGGRYIAYNTGGDPSTDPIRPRKVDSFRDLIQDTEREELDITFDILPAPMLTESGLMSSIYDQYPIVFEADPVIKRSEEVEEDYTPLQDLIEGDNQVESITIPTKMYLALYSGLQQGTKIPGFESYQIDDYPFSYVESLAEFFINVNTIYYFNDPEVNTFRLEWLKQEIYDKSANVDLTRKYKISLLSNRKLNLRARFVSNNKSLKCSRIERTVTHTGFNKRIKGEFYAYT